MGIKQPPNYVHPNKKKEGKLPDRRKTDLSTQQANALPTRKGNGKKSTIASNEQSAETQVIRLVARPPLPGQVKLYDNMLAGGLSSKQALLGLLKRGFDEFNSDLSTGKFVEGNPVLTTDGKAVETTRSIDSEFLKRARAVFDPFGILSDRALGQKIGEAIIGRAKKD